MATHTIVKIANALAKLAPASLKLDVTTLEGTFPSIGHVEKDGSKYRLIPSAWNPTI